MIAFFVKEIREKKGLSQAELEKLSGVSASHIGYIERGEREPTVSVLCKLAKALDVSILDLFEYHN